MRFDNYLREGNNTITDKEFSVLMKDIKFFLKEGRKNPLYRASRNKTQTIDIISPRSNRKPLDIPLNIHNELNKSFKRVFGWNVRKEGVFCSGSIQHLTHYGDIYYMFPIGKFKYVWSDEVSDILSYLYDNDFINDDGFDGYYH